MAANGEEGIGSMGNDSPLAVLSSKNKPLYSYFKQLFAQVTNPALDCIREELVTATETFIGSEGNLLDPGPHSCRMIRLDNPLLDNKQLAKLREVSLDGFKATTLDALFPADQGGDGLENAFDGLCAAADKAIDDGYNILIVSDRNIDAANAAMPTSQSAKAINAVRLDRRSAERPATRLPRPRPSRKALTTRAAAIVSLPANKPSRRCHAV